MEPLVKKPEEATGISLSMSARFVENDPIFDQTQTRDLTHELATRAAAIHLSPVHDRLHPRTLSEWALADRLPARIQLQLHKYIWDPSTRGV